VTTRQRIAVLGEALVDVVRTGDGASRACPGGSGLNTALALARLDAPVAFCGALSRDDEGARLSAHLAAEGVDLSCALHSDLPCPRVIATPGADGSPHYDLRLSGSALDAQPRAWRLPDDLIHLHATSFASTTGVQGEAALDAMIVARMIASTSYDPNVRRAVLPPMHEARALIAARIAQADIVKVSAEDLVELGDASGALLRAWRPLGPKLIVVTRGGAGAVALFDGGEIEATSPRVTVRDTIGAGDTFMAALLAEMLRDGALGARTGGFAAAQVARWLAFATQAAALCCTRDGCDPPRRAELEASRQTPNSVAPLA
jgi:fructokinase